MPGRGSSSQSSSASSSFTRPIPVDISFLILFEPLAANWAAQPARKGTEGNVFWVPPNKKNAYIRHKAALKLFRWKGGRVTEIPYDPNRLIGSAIHSTATVFTQYPDTDHLLAVDFDAEKKNVVEDPGGWKVLSFRHVPQTGTQRIYSFIDLFGAEQQMAAPGSPHWMPQLVPTILNYNVSQGTVPPSSAGLIGRLPILFALPAFSAKPDMLAQVLTQHLLPNRWVPHTYPSGHEPERGVVITVFLDPANKTNSTKTILDRLQEGHWGPFYGP